MALWVRALLDPTRIEQSPASAKKHISPPPKFDMPSEPAPILPPPSASRGRGRRSVSPSKIATPGNKTASPRKPPQNKAMKEANAANANAASGTLQQALDTAASTAESESVDGEREKVKIEVDSAVDLSGDTETTQTRVTVEMPAGSADLPLPEDTEKMLETAKEMVAEARKLEAESSTKPSRKRKAEELDEEDIDGELPVQPTKKATVLEDRLKREKVRTRAAGALVVTLGLA